MVSRVACFAVIAVIAGCAGPPPDRTTVYGVVKYLGRPVPQGFIHFHKKENPTVSDSGTIRKDGSYILTNAPLGPVKIVLQINGADDPLAVQQQGGKSALVLPQQLGRKYARLETTPVERSVAPGEQRIDVDIE